MKPKKTDQLTELIGLVYDTAADSSLWPRLLAAISDWIEEYSEEPLKVGLAARWVRTWFDQQESMAETTKFQKFEPHVMKASDAQVELLTLLGPHFLRAHHLHKQLADMESDRDSLERVTDLLPLGLAVVGPKGQVISINAPMLAELRSCSSLRFEANRLTSYPSAALDMALNEVVQTGHDRSLRLDRQGQTTTLWLSRMHPSIARSDSRVLILCTPTLCRNLSESGLSKYFGLTFAEARLVSQLAKGCSLEENAQALDISLNTAKTLLKRVFVKLGVSRQSELLQVLYTSPLWLHSAQPQKNFAVVSEASAAMSGDHVMTLPDGRLLSYSDTGNRQGFVLIYMHGIAGSRSLCYPDDEILNASAVRLIVPERPGTGYSSVQAQRAILNWPDDVAALVDHLGLKEFVVLGYSSGTPYALATARRMPERVKRVVLVASMPEITSLIDLVHYAPTFRMALTVGRVAPSLAPAIARVMVRGIRKNVYQYLETSLADATESDKRVFHNQVFRRIYADSLLRAARQGEEHIALEILLLVNAWGFALNEIQTPIDMWHGTHDHLVSLQGAQKLASQLRNVRLTMVPEAGHYLVYSHWQEILADLRSSLSNEITNFSAR